MVRRCGWVLALVSCFGTPPSASDGGDDDAPCPPGARLCPCDAGACDPGLTCAPSVDRCVSPECDVGEVDCPCGDAMQCEGDLVCIDGLCAGPSQDTGDDPLPMTTGPSTTAMPETTDGPGSLTAATTSSVTESTGEVPPSTGEVSSGAADTGSTCAAGMCTDCITCAMADDGPCAAEADACDMELMMMPPPCYSIWYGVQMCEANPSCTSCPAAMDGDGMALVGCLVGECGDLDCKCL